jgi:hypothetical protein
LAWLNQPDPSPLTSSSHSPTHTCAQLLIPQTRRFHCCRLVLAGRRPPPAIAGNPLEPPFRNFPEYLVLRPDCGACSSSLGTLATARLIWPSPAASSATAARRGSATELLDHADPTAPAGWQHGCILGDHDLLPRHLHAPTSTPVGRRCSSNPGVAVTPTSEAL